MPRIATPESGVLRACLDLLGYHKIWHRRWNSGTIRDYRGVPVRMGKKGDADILATPVIRMKWLHTCQSMINDSSVAILWIECKSDRGKQTSAQRDFEIESAKAGHNYIVVRKPEELIQWLRENGAIEE